MMSPSLDTSSLLECGAFVFRCMTKISVPCSPKFYNTYFLKSPSLEKRPLEYFCINENISSENGVRGSNTD